MNIDWSDIKTKKFIVNFLFHSIILFTILSVFFFKIIAPLSSDTINNEFTHIIKQNIKSPELIQKGMHLDESYIKLLKDNVGEYLVDPNKLISKLDKTDATVEATNHGLRSTLIASNVFAWIAVIILILLTTKYNCCDDNVDLKFMVVENVITFTFVGIVEFLFFKKIASKFVPVAPSFISSHTFQTVKNML
jgi:hypothetical protein